MLIHQNKSRKSDPFQIIFGQNKDRKKIMEKNKVSVMCVFTITILIDLLSISYYLANFKFDIYQLIINRKKPKEMNSFQARGSNCLRSS